VIASGLGDAELDVDLNEGRHQLVGLQAADLCDGHGEFHLGACRHLVSCVPWPKKGQVR
jgi:hypothetical protein